MDINIKDNSLKDRSIIDKSLIHKNRMGRKFINKMRKSKKGFTLVEVIVAFALTGILLAAASAVLGVFVKSFVRVTGTSEMEMAARTIMETVTGELERAAGGDAVSDSNTPLRLDGDGTVWYRNFEGKTAHMQVDESGELLIEYFESGQEEREAAMSWRFPENFYEKCLKKQKISKNSRIQKMEIVRIENRNLLEVTLEMKHRSGDMTYSMTRMFECYNLKVDEIV